MYATLFSFWLSSHSLIFNVSISLLIILFIVYRNKFRFCNERCRAFKIFKVNVSVSDFIYVHRCFIWVIKEKLFKLLISQTSHWCTHLFRGKSTALRNLRMRLKLSINILLRPSLEYLQTLPCVFSHLKQILFKLWFLIFHFLLKTMQLLIKLLFHIPNLSSCIFPHLLFFIHILQFNSLNLNHFFSLRMLHLFPLWRLIRRLRRHFFIYLPWTRFFSRVMNISYLLTRLYGTFWRVSLTWAVISICLYSL